MTPADGASGGEALFRLRDATRDAHGRLEARLDVVEALGCPQRRDALVTRYRRFHAAAAAMLRPWPMAGTRSWLDDHDAGGEARAADPGWWIGFAPRDAAEAAGCRYVIEGSALGGRVILKTLRARGVDTDGLEFLDPWGPEAGRGWRGFLLGLERTVRGEAMLAAAVAGAGKGFGFAEQALCGSAPIGRPARPPRPIALEPA